MYKNSNIQLSDPTRHFPILIPGAVYFPDLDGGFRVLIYDRNSKTLNPHWIYSKTVVTIGQRRIDFDVMQPIIFYGGVLFPTHSIGGLDLYTLVEYSPYSNEPKLTPNLRFGEEIQVVPDYVSDGNIVIELANQVNS